MASMKDSGMNSKPGGGSTSSCCTPEQHLQQLVAILAAGLLAKYGTIETPERTVTTARKLAQMIVGEEPL